MDVVDSADIYLGANANNSVRATATRFTFFRLIEKSNSPNAIN